MRLEVIRWNEPTGPREAELRRRLQADGYEASQWHDPPGARYEPHSHERDEILWVVAGRITFGVDGVDHELGPGDRLMLPKGTVHTARAAAEGATYWIGEQPDR